MLYCSQPRDCDTQAVRPRAPIREVRKGTNMTIIHTDTNTDTTIIIIIIMIIIIITIITMGGSERDKWGQR